jgi:hypothetical protein
VLWEKSGSRADPKIPTPQRGNFCRVTLQGAFNPQDAVSPKRIVSGYESLTYPPPLVPPKTASDSS